MSVFWKIFAAMAPWLLGGFLIAGIIAVWMPRSFVTKTMGGTSGFSGVLRAVLIGVPLPICSCGVIPISAALIKAGAGKGPTAGFLIATPQTGIDSVLATYALLGPFFAVVRPVAAFLSGLAGGMVVQKMTAGDADAIAGGMSCSQATAVNRSVREVLWQGYIRILGGVVKPLFLGLLAASLVTAFVPDSLFTGFLREHRWLSLPLMAVIGFPMYVCSTAAVPIAAALVMKGLSPGAALVFLMTGPAINAMSIVTVSSMIGSRATAAYVGVIIACAVVFGAVVDFIPVQSVSALSAAALQEHSPSLFSNACAAFLAVLMVNALLRKPKMN